MTEFDGLPLFAKVDRPEHDQDPTPDGAGLRPTDGAGLWLAIDPRRAGWAPGQDLGPFLARAVELFSAKPWAGGAAPGVIRANPTDAGNGTGTAAAELGLQVVPDPKVAVYTFWLGMGGGEDHDAV